MNIQRHATRRNRPCAKPALRIQLGCSNTVIGAHRADANATDSGAAYIFDFSACLPCLVDLNADGSVDVLDFFAFITLFATSDPAADLNTDGNIDVLDFFEFVNLFNTGCP